MTHSHRMCGYSLLEVLLVTALMAAAGLIVVAIFANGTEGMALRNSAKEVAAQLRYTRTQAIASGQPQQFEIDPATRRWRAPNGRVGGIPDTVSIHFVGAREAQPVTGTGAIRFFEDGASTGGRILLRVRDTEWRVDVAWLTGDVDIIKAAGEPAS